MLQTAQGLMLPQTLAELIDPGRAALLVYDMQVGICSQLIDGQRIATAVASLIESARSCGMRIAYSRHLSLPNAWLGATQTRMAMRWQHQADPAGLATPFARESAAFEIIPSLRPQAQDLIIDKIAMSAFEGTFLATAMRDCGLASILICGIATEVGIDPTIRHAADLGIVPVLVSDACGAGDAAAGERAIASLSFAGDVVLATSTEIEAALGAKNAVPSEIGVQNK